VGEAASGAAGGGVKGGGSSGSVGRFLAL
jgi:hypothetical protein